MAQRLFLRKARSWTADGLATIDQRLADGKAELKAAKVASVQATLKDEMRRVQAKTSKNIVYTFRTLQLKKDTVAKLNDEERALEKEKGMLATGKLIAPPLDLNTGGKLNDAGELSGTIKVVEVLGPRSFIANLHGNVYQIDNVSTANMEPKDEVPLPKWGAILSKRDYLNAQGNTPTIFIITAVDEFDPNKFPDDEK